MAVVATSARAQSEAEAQLADQYYVEQDYERAGKLYEKLTSQAPANELFLVRAAECRTQRKD